MFKRRVAKCSVPFVAAAVAAGMIGAPAAGAAGPVAATAGATASAALIVGGTTYPTVEQEFMEQLWPTWSTSLGLANTDIPSLINVAYPAELAPFTDGDPLGASVAAGVNNLVGLLQTTYSAGAKLIVWGISQGALVLAQTQRVLAMDPAAPPRDSLTFVRVADPSAAISGMLNFLPDLIMSDVLHLTPADRTAPSDSQYNTVVVTNEFDAFADFPNRPWNLLAVANAIAGLFSRHAQTGMADLTSVPAPNISTEINALGATITTYLVPSPFLPLTQPLRDAGVSAKFVDALDGMLWPIVKAGYTRYDPAAATATPEPGRALAAEVAAPVEVAPAVSTVAAADPAPTAIPASAAPAAIPASAVRAAGPVAVAPVKDSPAPARRQSSRPAPAASAVESKTSAAKTDSPRKARPAQRSR